MQVSPLHFFLWPVNNPLWKWYLDFVINPVVPRWRGRSQLIMRLPLIPQNPLKVDVSPPVTRFYVLRSPSSLLTFSFKKGEKEKSFSLYGDTVTINNILHQEPLHFPVLASRTNSLLWLMHAIITYFESPNRTLLNSIISIYL